MKSRERKLRKNPECPVCGSHPTVTKLIDYQQFCGIRGEEQKGTTEAIPQIQPEELKRRLDAGEDIFILDGREPHEYQICNLGGYLIPINDLPKRVNALGSRRQILAPRKIAASYPHAVALLH